MGLVGLHAWRTQLAVAAPVQLAAPDGKLGKSGVGEPVSVARRHVLVRERERELEVATAAKSLDPEVAEGEQRDVVSGEQAEQPARHRHPAAPGADAPGVVRPRRWLRRRHLRGGGAWRTLFGFLGFVGRGRGGGRGSRRRADGAAARLFGITRGARQWLPQQSASGGERDQHPHLLRDRSCDWHDVLPGARDYTREGVRRERCCRLLMLS